MSEDRFDRFLRRAKACYRAAASIDNARAVVQAAQLDVRNEIGADVGVGPLEEARRELAAAEGALFMAREKLQAAIKEKTLTPESRPGFVKGSSR
jgi:hypothetical protein